MEPFFKICCLFILISICFNLSSFQQELKSKASNEEEVSEEFIPNENWQTIRPGQKVPSGLHYRINLETGLKEAKVLQDEDKPQSLNRVIALSSSDSQEDTEAFKSDLKYESLRKMISTETELLIRLLDKYKKVTNDDGEKIKILGEIDYLVHKYDVGKDFIIEKGHELIFPDFNSSDKLVRAHVALVLGSAMQANEFVQKAIISYDGIHQLLYLVLTDKYSETQYQGLYALSCLLRHNPSGQKSFINQGGITVFIDVFKRESIYAQKIRLKIITLLTDLMNERKLLIKNSMTDDEEAKELINLYESFSFETELVKNGFCEGMLDMADSGDLDTIEKVVDGLYAFQPECEDAYKKNFQKLRMILGKNKLEPPYSDMIKELVLHYQLKVEL